tara:strand:+ start:2044 stop:2748 length:705 start_codon:yes stop_codon:yes gene_type:complete
VKKTFAVLGIGHFGFQVAITLTQKGFEVLAIDSDEEIVEEVKDLVSQSIIVDTTDEKAMRSINITNVDVAIVAIGSNVQSSLLTTALLQRMNVSEIHVRFINNLQESILKSMGIKNVIGIEKEMGIQLANTLSTEKVGRYISISERHSLMEIAVPGGLVNKTLKDLHIRSQFSINIVGIKTRVPTITDDGEMTFKIEMTDVPDPNYPLKKEDMLVIAGTDDNLRKFIKIGEISA